jgi:hypothetical protein
MNEEILIEIMLANTNFTLDEINQMEKWEMLSCLGLD